MRTVTVTNGSDHVIVVSHGALSREIPIGGQDTVQVDDPEGDCSFTIRFFSKRQMKTENKTELVRTVDAGYALWFNSESVVPLKTVVDLSGCSEVTVKDETIEFRFLTAIFKKISLIRPRAVDRRCEKKTLFVSDKDKCYFLRRMLIELIVTFVLFPILIGGAAFAFTEGWGWFETLLMCSTALAFVYCYCRKVVYYILYKK